jgi:hypothetical protein
MVQITLVHLGTNEFLYTVPGDGTRYDYHIDLFRYARHAGDRLYVLYYPPLNTASIARISVAEIQDTAQATFSEAALTMLPLRPPATGPHILQFSYPSVFAKSGWSRLQDAITSKPVLASRASSSVTNSGRTQWLTFTSAKPGTVLRYIVLRDPLPGDHLVIAGSIVAPWKSMVQITLVHLGTNEFLYTVFGDGTPHDYHIDLFRYARHAGDRLYVLYYPPTHKWGKARIGVTAIQG